MTRAICIPSNALALNSEISASGKTPFIAQIETPGATRWRVKETSLERLEKARDTRTFAVILPAQRCARHLKKAATRRGLLKPEHSEEAKPFLNGSEKPFSSERHR